VEREVGRHMVVDKYSQYGGGYTIASLYYDTFNLSDYFEKAGGLIKRKKFRLRIYEPYLADSKYGFLEIKFKDDMTNQKIRLKLTREEIDKFLSQGAKALLLRDWKKEELKVKDAILAHLIRVPLKPAALIVYKRKAFVSTDENLRITFDHDITAKRQKDMGQNKFMVPVGPGFTVMEVKYAYMLPYWMNRIIMKYNLERDAFSKYGRGLETLNRYNPLLK
jgi:SPX domain protein involved in polyphosphate accumulation